MKRVILFIGLLAIGMTAAFAYAAAPRAEPRRLLEIGKRYIFLSPAEVKRTAEVIEDFGGGWYKMKYKHSDGVERMIWMNLNQVIYFQPEDPNHPVPPPANDRSKLSQVNRPGFESM